MLDEYKINNEFFTTGYWDDCSGYQVLIYNNSKDEDNYLVFLMAGMDYGGGINKILVIPRNILDKILNKYRKSRDGGNYEFYEKLRSLADKYELKINLGSEEE